MIDLVSINNGCIECQKDNIFKRACFGLLEDRKKTHCKRHKSENMINLNNINGGCIECKKEGVFKKAGFGKLFETKIHCVVHKLSNEISNNNPRCLEPKCQEKPFYGLEKDAYPIYCELHKSDEHIDLMSRDCDTCLLSNFIPSNKTTCARCLGYTKKVRFKEKEMRIFHILKKLCLDIIIKSMIHDSVIDGGCSRRRPDFFFKDFSALFHLIVEIDEFQHSRYSCSYEGEMRRIIK